ncbi:FAD-dependent oxidoreductase [Chryseobacterium sp. MYb328]|uniref:FAD-dependent oxidoreductase n=1 Tax=Chryseobacterium sp. MYb328 TaxID=2745231 RepID=UPI0030B5A8E8
MQKDKKIVIIGGGLSALTTAYYLSKHNIDSVILEASPRLGGRIQTVKGQLETPLELGATWFSEMHTHLFSLIEELGLKKYPQFSNGISLFQTKSFEPPQKFFVPESQTPSYRIVGGTQKLIETLEETLHRTKYI